MYFTAKHSKIEITFEYRREERRVKSVFEFKVECKFAMLNTI